MKWKFIVISMKIKSFLLSLIVILIIIPNFSYGSDASITNVKVIYKNDMRVSFIVDEAFKVKMEEAIRSGITTSFTYKVKLYKNENLWIDELLDSWKFTHTVSYDHLKDEYTIKLGELDETVVTKDFSEMKYLMSSVDGFLLQTHRTIRHGQPYNIKIKAELDKIELPFYMDYMFFFVKLFDFETSWYSYRFAPSGRQ